MEILKKIGDFFKKFNADYFFTDPVEFSFGTAVLGFYIFILGLLFFLRIFLGKKIDKKDPRFSLLRASFWYFFTIIIIGFILVFFRMQAIPAVSKRILIYLDISFMFFGAAYFIYYLKKKMPQKVLVYLNKKRKEKWFK